MIIPPSHDKFFLGVLKRGAIKKRVNPVAKIRSSPSFFIKAAKPQQIPHRNKYEESPDRFEKIIRIKIHKTKKLKGISAHCEAPWTTKKGNPVRKMEAKAPCIEDTSFDIEPANRKTVEKVKIKAII